MSDSGSTSNANLRVMLVDDEEPALRLLSRMLGRQGFTRIVSFREPRKAARFLAEERPDLLFLDIHMPDMDGFTLLRDLPPIRRPELIVVSAYDEFAIRAFEVAAVDYLLKPFGEARLQESVRRVTERLAVPRPDAPEFDALKSVLAELGQRERFLRQLPAWAPGDERAIMVPVTAVQLVVANNKRLAIHTQDGSFHLRGPLRVLEPQLDPRTFVRVNRSAIVNTAHVREVQRWFGGDYVLVLRNGERMRTSGTYRAAVEGLLGLNAGRPASSASGSPHGKSR